MKFVIYENDSSKEGFFCRTTVRMLKENNAVDCDLRKVGFNMLLRSRWERADSSFPVSMVPPLSLYWVSHFNQESPTLSMPERLVICRTAHFFSFLSSDCYYFRSTPTSDHHQLLRIVLYTFDLWSSCCHCGKLCVCVCVRKSR